MKITNTFINTMLVSTSLFASQAYAAAPFSPEFQPLGYIGPMELSNTDLTNGAKAYRGWYENGGWQGDLIEYSVSDTGDLATSIDLSGVSPAQTVGGTNWSAHVQFAANAATSSHWDTGREIITSTTGINQVAFRWANLTLAQKTALDLNAVTTAATSSNVLDFLRGDRSQEKPIGVLRLRFGVMGDVIHSNPEYVGIPEGSFAESSYTTFKNDNLTRAPRIYVGANDGMLHAFNALNGNESWAYIPSMVMDDLSKLAGTPYSHAYFVDGNISVKDAYFGSAWHSVLLGSLGAGGKGLFALDVTHPSLSSENFSGGNDKKILWELNPASDNDLGHIFDATTVTMLNDGKWYAINGNGVSSANGVAKLYLVELSTGTVTKISTASGSAGSPNGLAAPALVDTNNDGMADIAFAGDIDGDMWRFDLTGVTPGSWKLDYKLYNGTSAQPITMAPDVAIHPQAGHLVLFGTGRLYTSADIGDATVQALYGIWDPGTAPVGGETRLAQLLSGDIDYVGGGFTESVATFTTVAPLDYAIYKGWQVDLPAGFRLLTQPQLRAGRLKTTISNPNGFANWLLEVTFDEGGVADATIYDLNRDGLLNTADRVDANGNTSLDDLEDIPMGWQRPDGTMSQVTIASLAHGVDTLFLNFLNPPLIPPVCIGGCTGGLIGGHMDVDTDSAVKGDGLGGKTDGHVHEYDDKFNRTYVDYYDIDPGDGGKLRNVTEVGIEDDEKFIVLIANADLSTGGELTINNKVHHVVKYQRMLHKALANWDGAGPLLDDDGDSLIFSLDSIEASDGGLKSTFDSLAIIHGGLHPTQTGCVNNGPNVTNGRWRNGSLIFQLVKASHFSGLVVGESALDRVVVQTPLDLHDVVILSDGTQVKLTEDLNKDSIIDGTSPAYEIYGGLVVRSNDEFLYESTLFWHFGDISKLVLGVTPCYGDPLWAQAYVIETKGVTEEVYDDLLAAAGFEDFEALEQRIEELEECIEVKECKDAYKKIEKLYRLGLLVEYTKVGGEDGGDIGGGAEYGGGLTGTPLVIDGGISEGGVTSGPNFQTGRRTWIDILPE
jgi:hypothetical protein